MDKMEPEKIISVSLGKIALSKYQRGGLRLHKSLMVAGVLLNARSAASTSPRDYTEIDECSPDSAIIDFCSDRQRVSVTLESEEKHPAGLTADELSDSCNIIPPRWNGESGRDQTNEADVDNSDDGIYDCETLTPSLSNNSFVSLHCDSSRSRDTDNVDDEIDSDADLSEEIGNVNSLQPPVSGNYQKHVDYVGLSLELPTSPPLWNKTSCDQTPVDYFNYAWQNRVSTDFEAGSKFLESEKWSSLHSVVNNNYRCENPASMCVSPPNYMKRQRHCSESSDGEGDYDISYSASKRLRYDSESSNYTEYIDKRSCVTSLAGNPEISRPGERAEGNGPQLTNLVNCFSSGFSGLLCAADPANQTSGFSDGVVYSAEATAATDFCDGKKEETDDIMSCSTQIREALETLSRPIIAMTV